MLATEYDFKIPESLDERLKFQLNIDDEDMPAIVDTD